MDRTLFTPAMIETFRVCRRAYQLAYLNEREKPEKIKVSALCKKFLLKALSEFNRGRVNTIPQAQKFLGQHWPADKLNVEDDNCQAQERNIQAFRFVYRVLTNYINRPYRPQKAEIAAVNLKVRARIAHSRVYLEDSFDLIFWHPQTKHLEFVDYHLHPLKPLDQAWPSASILVKQFLAQRLRTRWPFEKVSITFCQLQPDGVVTKNLELDEAMFHLHWPELVETVEHMKNPCDYAPHRNALCRRCEFLSECLTMGQAETPEVREPISRSA